MQRALFGALGWLVYTDWWVLQGGEQCEYKGCTNTEFANYDAMATIGGPCQGCMDSTAENYQPEAEIQVRLVSVDLKCGAGGAVHSTSVHSLGGMLVACQSY